MIDIILLIIAAMLNAVMDTLVHKHAISVFKNLDRTHFFGSQSYRRKYKDCDPDKGEAFLFSTTALVPLTDGWHLCKALMLLCIFTAIAPSLWLVPLLYIGWGVVFELFYSRILQNEKI